MVELSNAELDILIQKIESEIHDKQLQMELIDHCCCAVEEFMSQGIQFEMALDQAIQNLSPNGMREIEVEVQIILTNQTLHTMKIILFFSGFVAAFCIMTGILFRQLQWPGGDEILLAGNSALIVSMVTLIMTTMRSSKAFPKDVLFRILAGGFGGLFFGIGSFFKIMHWPGANIQVLLGIFVLAFFFLPLFFWQLYKRELKAA